MPSDADVPYDRLRALYAEAVDETWALIARTEQAEALVRDVAEGDGFTTQIGGALIMRCDEYGQTDVHLRAQRAEAALQAIRDLHQPVTWTDGSDRCRVCRSTGGWPCATYQACDRG